MPQFRKHLLPLIALSLLLFMWEVKALPLDADTAPVAGHLMEGTRYETPYHVSHGKAPGPTLLVIAGAHGDEPGAWRAAEELILRLRPQRGTLIVIPRANAVAVELGRRSTPELGDLNRLYGATSYELPMAEVAAEIVALVEEQRVDVVIDLHESWAPFVEPDGDGEIDTAKLGQTVSSDAGEYATDLGRALVERANEELASGRRFQFFEFPADYEEKVIVPVPDDLPRSAVPNKSSSYIAELVPGVATLLVEVSQQQPIERRMGQHYLLVRELLALMAEDEAGSRDDNAFSGRTS